jgi:hypothetical protein
MGWHLVGALSGVQIIIFLAGAALVPLFQIRWVGAGAGAGDNASRRLGEAAATPLLSGLLIAFIAVLTLRSFPATAVVISALAVIGAARLGWALFRGYRPTFNWRVIPSLLFVFILLLGIGSEAFFIPLKEWDSRSIWFFHAKIMTTLGGLHDAPIWTAPEIQFSSVIHPKLLPTVGAVMPSIFNVWNEFLPKAGLLLLAFPALMTLLCFSTGRASGWFLMILFPFAIGEFIFNGMADGYFALYGALAVLFLGRYLEDGARADLIHTLLCLGVTASIKSEGLMLIGVAALASGLVAWMYKVRPIFDLRIFAAALLSFAPIVLWARVKFQWGLSDQAHLNVGPEALERLMAQSTQLPFILHHLIMETGLWRALLFAVGAIVCAVALHRRASCGLAFVSITGVGFLCGLALIYAGGSADLQWMLDVSASRTTMIVTLLMIACVYRGLDQIIVEISARRKNNALST